MLEMESGLVPKREIVKVKESEKKMVVIKF